MLNGLVMSGMGVVGLMMSGMDVAGCIAWLLLQKKLASNPVS